MTYFPGTTETVLIGIVIAALYIILRKLLPSKGAIGEKRVAWILKKLPEERYKVINNLLIQNNGTTTQIDHIVVSVYGIFVIETKTYQGWIYGGENSDYWTQNIYGNKYQLRNPIHQNYGHIKALENILNEFNELPYISIVTFPRKARIKVHSSTPVIYRDHLLSTIYNFDRRVITERQVGVIFNILNAYNIDSKENRKKHIQSVTANIQKRKEVIEAGKCPRCGGELVQRHGRYGTFYGCSNYPKCRYTLK